jgi:hypothetical protein
MQVQGLSVYDGGESRPALPVEIAGLSTTPNFQENLTFSN